MADLRKVLEGFGIGCKGYQVTNVNKEVNFVLVGGVEVIRRSSIKDVLSGEAVTGEINVADIEEGLLPFMYVDKEYDVVKLERLLKYKSVDKLSNADITVFGVTAEGSPATKTRLESQIVYIHNKNPSTNSLAMAKQFKLNHKHVVEVLFEILV